MTVWRFLFISIALHFLIWTLLLKNAELHQKKDESIEVSVIDDPRLKSARGPKVPENLIDKDEKEKARFKAEEHQRVKEETQAKRLGLTRNKQIKISRNAVKRGEARKNLETARDTETSKDGFLKPKSLTDLGQTLFSETSTSEDPIDNVKDGMMTALNSERFTYYSFFSRVDEKTYPLAQRYFEETIEHQSANDLRRLSAKTWVTSVDIILSPRGDYLETVILKSCGIEALDLIPGKAFKEGAFYPNPPKAMIKSEDGKIHLNYEFHFTISDTALARRWSR